MSDGKTYLSHLPITDANQVAVEIQHKGQTHRFVLPRLVSVRDYTQWADKLKKREEALKMHNNKLPCVVDSELIERAKHLFPDAEFSNDGKATFYLTTKEEVDFATVVESCVEPKFTWGEAAYLARVDGVLVSLIASKYSEINNADEGVEQAKKD